MIDKQDFNTLYQQRADTFTTLLKQVKRSINIISNARLLVAALFFVVVYLGAGNNNWFYLLVPVVFGFIYLMQRHGQVFDKKSHLENLIQVNKQELQLVKRNFDKLATGTEFNFGKHPYAQDLDLFGEESVFQYINRCNTHEGKKRLAQQLLSPSLSRQTLLNHQQGVQELSSRIEFRQDMQAASKEMEEQPDDRQQLAEWLTRPSFIYNKRGYRWLLVLVPIVTVTSIAGSFFFPLLKSVAVLLALFQWGFLGFHLKRVNAFHEYISRKTSILKRYACLLMYIDKQEFSSPLLREIKQQSREASFEVNKLAALVNAFDARANSMMNLLVNSTLLYDLQCVYRLERWKTLHANKLEYWLEAATEMEVLATWGTFAFNHPAFTYPEIEEEAMLIQATALGHPLIRQHECVQNDLMLGDRQRIHIITGANMAGKSTYLRTVGVNLVLAYAGAPVCATYFRCSLMEMRSGMRATDSLKDHQSYFYAELDRLKSIIDELRIGKPLLILLDEMLKGTNSNDKLAGSIALVKQLALHKCLAIVATHDLALGELEVTHPECVRNFCFEALIENDHLSFDYKLKSGLAQNLNATFLMKQMGIIPK